MTTDRYERARAEVRDSTVSDQIKLERLAMIDVREERALERKVKRYTKQLETLRARMARSREDRERAEIRRLKDEYRARQRHEEQPEGV